MNRSEIEYLRSSPEAVTLIRSQSRGNSHSYGDSFVKNNTTFNEAFDVAGDWFEEVTPTDTQLKSKRKMRRELRKHIMSHTHFSHKPAGFFMSSWFMMTIVQTIVGWIVNKIIEHIFNRYYRGQDS